MNFSLIGLSFNLRPDFLLKLAMVQIFLLGDSFVYGVGANDGGWGDLLKKYFHKKMYSSGGVGEKYEVYNFGKAGEGIEFVEKTFRQQLDQYGRDGEIITVVSVGTNDIKAKDSVENFVSTINGCLNKISKFVDFLVSKKIKVIMVGSGFFDETKSNPKISSITGRKSFFTNNRQKDFLIGLENLCTEKGVSFVDIGVDEKEWKEKYLYIDGVHPNQKGHNFIADKVLSKLNELGY